MLSYKLGTQLLPTCFHSHYGLTLLKLWAKIKPLSLVSAKCFCYSNSAVTNTRRDRKSQQGSGAAGPDGSLVEDKEASLEGQLHSHQKDRCHICELCFPAILCMDDTMRLEVKIAGEWPK